MRTPTIAIVAAFAAHLFAAGAAAQNSLPNLSDPAGGPEAGGPQLPELTREERLEQLFATLATTDDPRIAERTADRINAIWLESGSATIDLLMRWALRAIQDEDVLLALDFLDRVVLLDPTYVEGWNKRATVFFMADDYGKSLGDLERVLAIEPRHFGALSGLGTIMRSVGENERAIEAYRRALEIDPNLDAVRDALIAVEAEVDGRRA